MKAEIYHNLSSGFLKTPDDESLKSDYMKLFVGPYKLLAPPWESVYRSAFHLVCQEPFLEVRKLYREAGLVLNKDFLDDHIGIELEFMSYLTKNNMNELKERFVNEHLIKWVPDFCDDCLKHAQTSFYKELALNTKNLILEEVN